MTKSIIDFPCAFTIKVMGPNLDTFTQAVTDSIHKHYGPLDPSNIRKKMSQNNKYQSISLDIHATSQKQLDQCYLALNKIEGVLMVL